MAFQTSCAAAGGLNCLPDVVADDEGRELVQHGSALFPIACYEEDLKSYSVAWHWHEEFEYILAVKGPLAVDVSKARLILQTGQGVFVNSGTAEPDLVGRRPAGAGHGSAAGCAGEL